MQQATVDTSSPPAFKCI